jgi:hypothetical protein
VVHVAQAWAPDVVANAPTVLMSATMIPSVHIGRALL